MVLLQVSKMEVIFLKLNSFVHMNSKKCLNIQMKTSHNNHFLKQHQVILSKASKIKNYSKLSKKDKSPQKHHLAKAIRENPYPLLDQEYERDIDIQPCLDAIPDGIYIQYFADFALIDHQNNLNLILI